MSTRRLNPERRRYLIAVAEKRVCPKCARPMFMLCGPPPECWRCYDRRRESERERLRTT